MRCNFKSAKLKDKWNKLTGVKEILQSVLGLKLEILGDSSVKHNSCISQFSKEHESTINLDVQKLLAKGQPVSVPW